MLFRILIGLTALSIAAGCSSSPEPEEVSELGPHVAVVAGEPIYARDFVVNYELGFPHLRRGDDPRRAYLHRVVDEKLLALEGYRRGLDQKESVQRRLASLREELLVEQVFERYVNDGISVSSEEILTAMQEDHVAFRLRYLPFPTHSEAAAARRRIETVGFERVLDEFVEARPDVPLRRSDFESRFVTSRDINPELLDAVDDLPVGDVSQPVNYHGNYLLMEVLDVRREPVGPVTDPADRSRYEQVVFQRKARTQARSFIGEMMKPLDVRLKPEPYVRLRNSLWKWHRDEPPQENLSRALEAVDAPYGDSIRAILPDVLMTTREGSWTVGQFLEAYPIERYPLRHDRAEDFETDFYDAIGLTLRDRAFVQRAESEGLDRVADVAHELDLWSDKWVYRALVDEMQREGKSVDGLLKRLRARYAVEVRSDVLDTLTLSDPESPGLTLLKGHTMRPAFPVADATW